MTTATTSPSPLTDEELLELEQLRKDRQRINDRIRFLIGKFAQPPDEDRPTWGPCTRCGHVWQGFWKNRPPRACPLCGSGGWQTPPKGANARRPDDAPNPRWRKKRNTGPARETPRFTMPRSPEDPIRIVGRLAPPPRPEDIALPGSYEAVMGDGSMNIEEET